MKTWVEKVNEKFLKIADAISFGMGTPTNILFWVLAVLVWIFLGMFRSEWFVQGNFLPGWFVSSAWNFPLNTITTLLEMYIGFLVAAATNRAERELRNVIEEIRNNVKKVEEINTQQNKILEMLVRYEKRDLERMDEISKVVEKK